MVRVFRFGLRRPRRGRARGEASEPVSEPARDERLPAYRELHSDRRMSDARGSLDTASSARVSIVVVR
jgi:hypothetical protein